MQAKTRFYVATSFMIKDGEKIALMINSLEKHNVSS